MWSLCLLRNFSLRSSHLGLGFLSRVSMPVLLLAFEEGLGEEIFGNFRRCLGAGTFAGWAASSVGSVLRSLSSAAAAGDGVVCKCKYIRQVQQRWSCKCCIAVERLCLMTQQYVWKGRTEQHASPGQSLES